MGFPEKNLLLQLFSRSNWASKFRGILDMSAEALGRSGRTQKSLFVPCELVSLQKVYTETCTSWRVRAPISAEPMQEEEQLCAFTACYLHARHVSEAPRSPAAERAGKAAPSPPRPADSQHCNHCILFVLSHLLRLGTCLDGYQATTKISPHVVVAFK